MIFCCCKKLILFSERIHETKHINKIQINIICYFFSSKDLKNAAQFPQKCEATVFNIDNNKCIKSSYYYDF